MARTPSIHIWWISFSLLLRRCSLSAIGRATMLASTAPYRVVSKATAICGPIAFGSFILTSMPTKPTSVPIIPMAGATSPTARQTRSPQLWRSIVCCISLAMTAFTTSWLLPSTSIWIPSFKKDSEMAAFSRASKPSLRPIFARFTISAIRLSGSWLLLEKARPATLKAPRNCFRENFTITVMKVPPITISMDGTL